MIPGRFVPAVKSILDERFYPLDWVNARIADGSAMLMESADALICIEKRIYPGGAQEVHGLFAVGDIEEIKGLITQAEDAGRLAGCTIAAIESRSGWAKALKGNGYHVEKTRIVKDLTDGA